MNTKIIATITAIALLGFAYGVSADNVGLSGECYNSDASQGGSDELRVHTDGSDPVLLPGTTNDDDPTDGKGGAADALVLFGTEAVKDGGSTGNACERYDCRNSSECGGKVERRDYLEVSAEFGSIFVQACYDASVTIAGDCPTTPQGPGSD